MTWVVALASFRPHGAFCPFAPFSSVVDDRTTHEGEQRRRLADFAGILGVPMFSVEPSVCLAPHPEGHALFRADARRVGFRVWNSAPMDAHLDRVQRTNAGLLVVSTLDSLVAGASISAELARDALRALAAVAAKRRIAVLLVHDSPRSGGADLVGRAIFESASIVFAPASPTDPSPWSASRHRARFRVRAPRPRPGPRAGTSLRARGRAHVTGGAWRHAGPSALTWAAARGGLSAACPCLNERRDDVDAGAVDGAAAKRRPARFAATPPRDAMGHLATMERRVRVRAEALAEPRGAASTPTLPASREAARVATATDAAHAIT